jgi:hypothetical protein
MSVKGKTSLAAELDVGKDLAVEGKCSISQLTVQKSLDVEGRTVCANVDVAGMLQVRTCTGT